MVKLKIQTALGAGEPLSATIGVLSISENNDLALASLAKSKTSKASQVFGMSLPDVGRYSKKDANSIFWIGPDQWMVCGDGKAEFNFAQEVKSQVPDAYVTEQSNGWVCFDVMSSMEEKPIEDFLERLINIDLQLVKSGRCVRTGLHHMNVCVLRPDANKVSILGMRSYAGSLWYHLCEAAERLKNFSCNKTGGCMSLITLNSRHLPISGTFSSLKLKDVIALARCSSWMPWIW